MTESLIISRESKDTLYPKIVHESINRILKVCSGGLDRRCQTFPRCVYIDTYIYRYVLLEHRRTLQISHLCIVARPETIVRCIPRWRVRKRWFASSSASSPLDVSAYCYHHFTLRHSLRTLLMCVIIEVTHGQRYFHNDGAFRRKYSKPSQNPQNVS